MRTLSSSGTTIDGTRSSADPLDAAQTSTPPRPRRRPNSSFRQGLRPSRLAQSQQSIARQRPRRHRESRCEPDSGSGEDSRRPNGRASQDRPRQYWMRTTPRLCLVGSSARRLFWRQSHCDRRRCSLACPSRFARRSSSVGSALHLRDQIGDEFLAGHSIHQLRRAPAAQCLGGRFEPLCHPLGSIEVRRVT